MRQRMLKPFFKKMKWITNEKGMSLIDVIAMLIVLGIAVPAIMRLSANNTRDGAKYFLMTRAIYCAEAAMEQIVADYRSPSRGYGWVITHWSGAAPSLEAGFTGLVTISSESSFNGVPYVTVTLTVSNASITDVVLQTRLFAPYP